MSFSLGRLTDLLLVFGQSLSLFPPLVSHPSLVLPFAFLQQILGSQQQGLSHLLKTLDSDNKSIDVVLKGLEGVGMIGR